MPTFDDDLYRYTAALDAIARSLAGYPDLAAQAKEILDRPVTAETPAAASSDIKARIGEILVLTKDVPAAHSDVSDALSRARSDAAEAEALAQEQAQINAAAALMASVSAKLSEPAP